MIRRPPSSTLFPYTPLSRSRPPLPFTPGVEICGETEDGRRVIANPALPHGGFAEYAVADAATLLPAPDSLDDAETAALDRKSTRLNSSHSQISYAVFCLKKK